MKKSIKRNRLLTLLLSCIMVFGLFSVTAAAANTDGNPQPFSFDVDKNVVKGGEVAPGKETFTFELVYGTVEENNQHMVVFTPDDSVTLADCGISFTNNTITTNGAGEKTFSLGGTVDLSKLDAAHHWQNSTGNDSVTKQIITLRLTEKNDGKAGWTYSPVERYLTISVKGNEISTDVSLLGNDVYDNNFENIYTAYSFTVKKTDESGKALAGATFSLTGTGNSIGNNFEAVSGNDGIATFIVPEGFYTLAEKTAPNGYIKSDKTYGIAIWDGKVHLYNENASSDNEQYTDYKQVTFVNKAEMKSPETGDNNVMGIWFAMLFVTGTAAVGTSLYRKRSSR